MVNSLHSQGIDGTGIGICSDAVSNAYKTNRIRQFDTNIQEGGCTPSP